MRSNAVEVLHRWSGFRCTFFVLTWVGVCTGWVWCFGELYQISWYLCASRVWSLGSMQFVIALPAGEPSMI